MRDGGGGGAIGNACRHLPLLTLLLTSMIGITLLHRKEPAMNAETTLTVKGQVTIPAEIRDRLDLRPGDRLRFLLTESGILTVEPHRRRSIFERLDELKLPALGHAPTPQEIDDAVASEMAEQDRRVRRRSRR
jgi:AbrB family looped-hinge helix DNA binding protein